MKPVFVHNALLPLCLFLCLPLRSAITFDWDSASFTVPGDSGTIDSGGITLTFDTTRFGTAAGNNTVVHSSGNLLFFSENDFNGATPSTDTLDDYSTLTISFSQPVTLVGNEFTILDVDDNDAPRTWQDFISVDAVNGIDPVSVSYTREDAVNQESVSNYYGRSGVVGRNNTNATPAGAAGMNVDIGVASPITGLTIFFAQGDQGDAAGSHGILFSDIVVVPEVSTLAMAGLFGLAGILLVTCRRYG